MEINWLFISAESKRWKKTLESILEKLKSNKKTFFEEFHFKGIEQQLL